MSAGYLMLMLAGPTVLLLALSLLTHKAKWQALAHSAIQEDSAQLLYLSLALFPIGLAIIVTHNIWDWRDLRTLLTVLGWLIIIRSVAVVTVPGITKLLGPLVGWATRPNSPAFTFGAIVWLLLGAALTWRGYFA